MASWTLQVGFPFLQVVEERWEGDFISFTLKQGWFLADGSGGSGEGAEKIWSIPLLFASSVAQSAKVTIMSSKTQTFKIPLGPNDWIKINAGQAALVRVAHSKDMIARLQRAITSKELPAEDRAALLLDAYCLAKANLAQVESVVLLLRAYVDEDNYTVWSAIESVLNGLRLIMEQVGGDAHHAFMRFGSRLVRNGLQRFGWDAESGHTQGLLQALVLELAEKFCMDDAEVLTEARRRFDAHWDAPAELPPEIKVYKQ